ncbi:hypothetical protein BKA65DRAFT_408814, partial [Rhexocercosporidium sp. MPI-PUGE-AT-0058]
WRVGIVRNAAEAVIQWAVRRFIAKTERDNSRSGRVLEKLGFMLSGTDYCKCHCHTLVSEYFAPETGSSTSGNGRLIATS